METKLNIMDFIWLTKALNTFLDEKVISQKERDTLIAEIAVEQNLPVIYL